MSSSGGAGESFATGCAGIALGACSSAAVLLAWRVPTGWPLRINLYKTENSSLLATVKVELVMEPHFQGEVILDVEDEREKARKIVDFQDGDIVRVQVILGGKYIDCKCRVELDETFGEAKFTMLENCNGFKVGDTFWGSRKDVVEMLRNESNSQPRPQN